ncbi:MAG: TIGR04563 family protein [Myxococcota bacterium]
MKNAEKRKQSLYFPVEMLEEMQREAERLERPVSWIIQQAWKLSKEAIGHFPSTDQMAKG